MSTVRILDLEDALILNSLREGVVWLREEASLRTGKNNSKYMTGTFVRGSRSAEFKIWEQRLYEQVLRSGTGLYYVQVEGSQFNSANYLTVKELVPYRGTEVGTQDFLAQLEEGVILRLKDEAYELMRAQGVSEACFRLTEQLLHAPELGGRFWTEAAAIKHHDNALRGLAHHSLKMLKLGACLLSVYPELRRHADLFFMGIMIHDVGKVFEYDQLTPGKYWYANHRVRGIEFLAAYRDLVISVFGEEFYRHLQSIIQGHHGEYQDRPTTAAALIVHWIDSMESQVTGFLEQVKEASQNKVYLREYGYLEGFPKTR